MLAVLIICIAFVLENRGTIGIKTIQGNNIQRYNVVSSITSGVSDSIDNGSVAIIIKSGIATNTGINDPVEFFNTSLKTLIAILRKMIISSCLLVFCKQKEMVDQPHTPLSNYLLWVEGLTIETMILNLRV